MSRIIRPDMRVRYASGVTDGGIDRDAWAQVVSQLLAAETGSNKTRFAELVGVTYKTVLRWVKGTSEVSEDSVRQVARALHISPLELLFRVGYYTVEDLDAATRVANDGTPPVEDDPALRVILDAAIPPRTKQRMIQRLYELRERDAARQAEEARFWVDQAQGA